MTHKFANRYQVVFQTWLTVGDTACSLKGDEKYKNLKKLIMDIIELKCPFHHLNIFK